jgi:hypothetical protein
MGDDSSQKPDAAPFLLGLGCNATNKSSISQSIRRETALWLKSSTRIEFEILPRTKLPQTCDQSNNLKNDKVNKNPRMA